MTLEQLFSDQTCKNLLPPERADEFFEALFGDASEGSYDLELKFVGDDNGAIRFDILLHERPGHCLACNLTYGLPQVFSRHPVIDIQGIVDRVGEMLADERSATGWSLGATRQLSSSTHAIPLVVELQ